ncbi:precorrin-3B synthase [Nocardia bovistercoris]|uniref:Precorrin-3B synthase n=1 Tax=Nocardia bovistercoris TaxID=2785916 RepID=A0A931N5V4_9NOCA|nr:precorrin-3B synthase [Nocardia bovistercoris]MBH0779811.1 precorrin-3B synthase [Nocardia bovistercoris]
MTRRAPDSCPGVLRLHRAADGPLARIRLPGGQLTPARLAELAAITTDLADGNIELTSRGNLQLRRVRDAAALTDRLTAAGLLPSRTHERVRNIVASPLSGRLGGLADMRDLVVALDEGLCAAPELAELPGRVLITLDDGRGDVSALSGDIGVHAVGADEFALVLAGRDSGVRIGAATAVDVLLTAARGFLALDSGQWRLHDITDGPARVLDHLGLTPAVEPLEFTAAQDDPIGWLTQDDGAVTLGAGVRLGTLPARTAEFVAAVDHPILVTPWRGLLVTDLDEWAAEQVVRVLAPMGLIFDAESPWLRVSACAGLPGCAKSHTDVRADASDAVTSGRVLDGETAHPTEPISAGKITVGGRQHWSGCERRCGRPRGEVTDVTATPDGYRID